MTTSTLSVLTAAQVKQEIAAGLAQPTQEQVGGCARVYVCLYSGDDEAQFKKMIRKPVAKACKELKKIFQVNGHGVRNAISIGYYNGRGIEVGQAHSVMNRLKAIGVDCYVEYIGD